MGSANAGLQCAATEAWIATVAALDEAGREPIAVYRLHMTALAQHTLGAVEAWNAALRTIIADCADAASFQIARSMPCGV